MKTRTLQLPINSSRGSALVVALIFAAIVAISLVSYLKLANNSLKQSDRSFYNVAATNLTEMGLEEAMTTLNRHIGGDTSAFGSWTITGNNATRKLTGFVPAPNTTGTIKIYIQNYNSAGSYSASSSTSTTSDHSDHSDHDDHDDDHADDHVDTHSDHTDSHSGGGGADAEFDEDNESREDMAELATEADSDDHSDHSDDHSDHSDDHSDHSDDHSTTTTTTTTSSSSSSGVIVVVVQATITPSTGNGPTISKYVEVSMSRRSYFGLGLVARDRIDFSGANALVDSWKSDPDNSSSTPAVAYSTAVRTSNATVAVASTAGGAINISNGEVLGYVRTGGGALAKGPTGMVHAAGTTTHNPARVSTDFSANFPSVTLPTPSATNSMTSSLTSSVSLPRSTDLRASDGKYYYNFASGYAVNLAGDSKVLTITGACVLIFDNHAGVPALTISGNASLSIASSASLTIYTRGNISIGGNGIANANNQPSTCTIFSTNTVTTQSISVRGNGQLSAAIYAPNADITINGGGSSGAVSGAAVGRTITMTGNATFHYDESLGVGAGNNPVRIGKWKELRTNAERAAYQSALNF